MGVTRSYKCTAEGEYFETFGSIKDDVLRICPDCGAEVIRVFDKSPDFIVENDPKTLGVLADRNRKKMGRSLIEAKEYERKQRQEKGKEVAREELLAKLPNGASLPERPKGNPWFRSNISKPLTGLNKYTPEEKTKYLMTGKEIPGKPVDSTS